MIKKCIHCKNEFDQKRYTQVYCSPVCRAIMKKSRRMIISVPLDILESDMTDRHKADNLLLIAKRNMEYRKRSTMEE